MIVADDRVPRFISERLGIGLCPPFTAMGIEKGGEIVAGALFNHFEGTDVHVGIAGTGWTRAFIRAVGEYVYDKLGCERMTIVTADPKVAEYAQRLGGKVEGRLRSHFGPGKDAIVAGILREEYRVR